jgi:hypothetical protein
MIDGEISGNTVNDKGGGVRIDAGGVFELVDGVISGNTAESGGGVYNNDGKFTCRVV